MTNALPVSDLRSILEDLPPLAARNLSAIDAAEALRPRLAPLLIQQIAPLNQALPVMTLDTDLEHMLITMVRQSGEEGLILDNMLAEQLLRKISETSEAMSATGKQAVMVVSPAIRRQFAQLVRQHIEDMAVLAFTELPDSRKIEVVATISGDAATTKREFVMTTITVTAADTAQAMDKIVERLGEDALILETVKRNGRIEMIATNDPDEAQIPRHRQAILRRGTSRKAPAPLDLEVGGGSPFTDLFDQQMINTIRDRGQPAGTCGRPSCRPRHGGRREHRRPHRTSQHQADAWRHDDHPSRGSRRHAWSCGAGTSPPGRIFLGRHPAAPPAYGRAWR